MNQSISFTKSTLLLFILLMLMALTPSAQAQFWSKQQPELLADHQAFMESAEIVDGAINVVWQIADDYYMYRDQFAIVPVTEGLQLGAPSYPQGVVENDPEFGEVVVYFKRVEYRTPILTLPESGVSLELELKAQGCNKPVGVCYAPQTRLVSLAFDPAQSIPNPELGDLDNSSVVSGSNLTITSAETQALDNLTKLKSQGDGFWGILLGAFGVGILLSFTACVLPMIPILAGVIAQQGGSSNARSGWLSICYVLGTVVTNAIAGALVGYSGTQLQAFFQSPWAIGIICGILVILAISLFGAFKIQLPSSVQTKLSSVTVNSRSASFSTFCLGLVSALVVGACVSPVLIGLLTTIINSGDPLFGAMVMSFVALGLGTPLVLFGFGAGWLLPKAGPWMNQIQVLFGFMVLGVAIFIASALPAVPTLYLWAVLLFWAGSYLLKFAGAIAAMLFSALLRGAGFAAILWGALALVGATTGGTQILSPLENLQLGSANNSVKQKVDFNVVTSVAEAERLLAAAKTAGQPALVDFYADWCLDCKRMDRTTFTKADVHRALEGWALIKIDVTQTNDTSQAVKRKFEVFGPPATLFFNDQGVERTDLRQYGYLDENDFLNLIRALQRDT